MGSYTCNGKVNMHCDKCFKTIEEDDTYERLLCGNCQKTEELPAELHCATCGGILKWLRFTERAADVAHKLRFLKYPAWIAFILAVLAFEWRNMLYTQILLGIAVVLVALAALLIAIATAFPGFYFLGRYVGKKLKWDVPDFHDSPAGIITWLFGTVIASSPILIWLLGLLFLSIGKRFFG